MERRKFIQIAGAAICIAGAGAYLWSDKRNFIRTDMTPVNTGQIKFQPDEKEILYMASLAPSGHNTQPWFVQYAAPYHWIICNDKNRWLTGVDPTQRETILSLGAFLQNLEYAAGNFGYQCHYEILATTNRDESIVDMKLVKSPDARSFDIEQIKLRRTVRSNYLNDRLSASDITYLKEGGEDFIHFIDNSTPEYRWLNEQTIEANRMQSYNDNAQSELAEWIRFSGKEAARNYDGLTTASMEIEGIPGWFVRNFYGKKDVMKKSFREQSIDKVKTQVANSAGWFLITSDNNSFSSLIETGKRLQRLLLKIRRKNIAIHPMTQVLEEAAIAKNINSSTGLTNPVQFVLRTGYLKKYPQPVSLRRPVDLFVKAL